MDVCCSLACVRHARWAGCVCAHTQSDFEVILQRNKLHTTLPLRGFSKLVIGSVHAPRWHARAADVSVQQTSIMFSSELQRQVPGGGQLAAEVKQDAGESVEDGTSQRPRAARCRADLSPRTRTCARLARAPCIILRSLSLARAPGSWHQHAPACVTAAKGLCPTCAARRRQELKAWQDARKKKPPAHGCAPRAVVSPGRKSRESVLLGYSLSRYSSDDDP